MKFLKKSIILKKDIIIVLFFSVILIISGCTKDISQEESPDLSCENCNVIFLNIELLRADYVGLISNEYEKSNTPNIDRFFNNSIIFEDASAPSGATIVSNIAVLTSIDPFIIHKIVDERYDTGYHPPADRPFLRNYSINYFSRYPTIAQKLYAKNYTTININDGGHTGQYTFMDAGFEKYYEATNIYLPNGVELNTTFIILQREIQLLEHRDANTDAFFLLVHSNLLHALPYTYPIDHLCISDSKIVSIPFPEKGEQLLFFNFSLSRNTPVSFQDKSFWMWKYDNALAYNNVHSFDNTTYAVYHKISHQLYAQQVQYVDEELGNIFTDLEHSGLLNNTIIVIYANHGDGLFDNKILNHDTSYQSNVHVPLLIRHPKIKQQLRIKTPIALIDLTQSIDYIINMNKNTISNNTYGGFVPIFLNDIYARQQLFGISNSDKYVRYHDMKLILFNDNRKELYNITADPHELNNIAAAHPEIVKEFSDALTQHEIQLRAAFNETKGMEATQK